jgi:hypothetical protein
MRQIVLAVVRSCLARCRVCRFAVLRGFRQPTHPPVASAYRAAVYKTKISSVVVIRSGKRGRPLQHPRHLYTDRGYGHEVYRYRVRRFEITPRIARLGTEHGSGLGVRRWAVEATIALPHRFRRLRIRREIRDDTHEALITPGYAIIYRRRLKTSSRFQSLRPIRATHIIATERTHQRSEAPCRGHRQTAGATRLQWT